MPGTTRSLRGALDALFGLLLVFTVASALATGEPGAWLVTTCAVIFGGVYAIGRVRIVIIDDVDAPRGENWPERLWMLGLLISWTALLGQSQSALWIAFPLMFMQMHVLGLRWGTSVVILTTVVAVFGALSAGLAPLGSILGPALGAGVAIGVVRGLEAVVREAQQRLVIIDELKRTRAELTAAEGARATIAERERLAREIHDTLAQGFSSIGLLLRAVATELDHGSTQSIAAARVHIDTAQQAVAENLLEARHVVRALAPPALDAANLLSALQRLAERSSQAGPVDVQLQVSGEPRELPAPVETALLRIAQSALANVLQHAQAQRAGITVTFYPHAVTLDVVDDGHGFDPEALIDDDGAGSAGGFGITAMRSRVAELGGTLELESAPYPLGRRSDSASTPTHHIGTALVVQIPLPSSADED